ncbi:hypothetical protein V6C27_12210 [Peptococcaceae bacterium 1198_IL3148]
MQALAALAGLVAAVVSWLINGKLIAAFGKEKTVIFTGPAVEELLKTGFALALASPVIISHIAFGVAEAIWELYAYKRGVVAGFFAVLTHALYGVVTVLAIERVGAYAAPLLAYIVHMFWNYGVIYYQKLVGQN